MLRLASLITLLAIAPIPLLAAPAPGPSPEKYICPNKVRNTAVECFLNAVEHLYTMCRQVKSIEIIEFGYEMAEKGVNGAKSEYCVDKQKQSMARPYDAALREARKSRPATEALRVLHELWLKALAELKWRPPESDTEYRARVAKPYDVFREQAEAVRVALASKTPKATALQLPKAGIAAPKGS